MFTVQQIQDLQAIMDSDPTIELIEIWGKVLYVRRSVGRCTFMSKPQSLKEELDKIYINLKQGVLHVQKLLFKYHPDRSKSKCAAAITQGLLQWKQLLGRCDLGEKHTDVFESIAYALGSYASIQILMPGISFEQWLQSGFRNGFEIVEEGDTESPEYIDAREYARKAYASRFSESEAARVDNSRRKPRSVRNSKKRVS